MSKSYGSYKKPKNIYGEFSIRRDLKLKTGSAVVSGESVDPIFYSAVRNREITSLDGVEVVVLETPSVKDDALLDGRVRRYSTVSFYIARYNDATQAEADSCLSEVQEMYPVVITGSTTTDAAQYKSVIGDTTNTDIYGGFVDATEYKIVVGTPSYTTPVEDAAALDSPRDGNTYGRQDGEWVQVTGGEGGGAVDSVFGRIGVVAAQSGDYTATQITNNSGTAGATVGAALTSLQTAVNSKATAAQGALADSAVQPGDLSTVATSGSYADLSNAPTVPVNIGDLANVDSTAPTNNQVLAWSGTSWSPADQTGGGGSDFSVAPVVTPVDPPAADQGTTTTATQTADAGWPGLVWYFYDYTGTPGSYNRSSSSGIVGIQENVPGNYTMKVRAAWPFGISDPQTINIVINAFTLTRETMFGGMDGLRLSGSLSSSSGWNTDWLPIAGAVAYDGGAYTFDIGSIEADTANCIAFYDYVNDYLLAFKYNSGSTIDGVYEWTGVATLPAQGTTLGNSFTQYMSDSGQIAAATSSVIAGKRAAVGGGYYHSGLGSSHFLEITPSGSEFDNFGSKAHDWSYGFLLADDWMADGALSQMLSPTGAGYFVSAITGYGIGASPYEYVAYGNSTSGPYTSSSNDVSWNIQTNNWKVGQAGDLVVVTYDGTGTDTWKVYVEGTLIFSTTGVNTYMTSGTTPTALRLGDFTQANGITGYPTAYDKLTGWYARLDSLFVANGTAFDQTQVTELTADKADLTLSDNYASITTLAEFDGSGVTNVKGSASYSRGDISFS